MSTESAIFRTWRPACTTCAWSFFIIYQALIGYDKYVSIQPICSSTDQDYPSWYWYTCYGVLGAFVIIWMVVLGKLTQIQALEEKVPHLVAFHVISMGTAATILALLFNWGGLCIDVLGVASPAAIWGEWCACGPLLIYVVVALDNKLELTKMDCFLMGTFFVCLITGFFIIIPSPEAVGKFWLIVSCVTYVPVLYLPWYCDNSSKVQLITAEGDIIDLGIQRILSRKQSLAWVLTIILPLYTVNYLIAYCRRITPAQTIAIYQVLSVLTKGFFVCIAMDIHLDLLESARQALSTETVRRTLLEENFRNITEARRNFLKYIFHELRSPLNSLAIGIEVLENSEDLKEGDLESLGLMKVASTFMGDTLNNVLNIQKIEEGKLELEMAPFSISDAVLKVQAALRGGLLQKRIRLVLCTSTTVPELVVGDGYHIEHAVGNLISNAIKFSPNDSEIVVNISAEKHTDEGSNKKVTVVLAVKDEGPGMTSEEQEKLFQNFVQTRPGQLFKGAGAGLGLTIAKQIVKLHGGQIGVKSVKGQGCEFYFAIPFEVPGDESFNSDSNLITTETHPTYTDNQQVLLSMKDSRASELSEKAECALWQKPSSKSSKKIKPHSSSHKIFPAPNRADLRVLVVDDSESIVKMMKMLLKKFDIVADTAENGRIAVDMIMGATAPYHLVLMDNLMPEMNGVEATKLLRHHGCDVLIVGVTGNVLEDDVLEYLAAGADMILPKPLKIRSLQLLLEFIWENGPAVVSRPDCQLEERNDQMKWVTKEACVDNYATDFNFL